LSKLIFTIIISATTVNAIVKKHPHLIHFSLIFLQFNPQLFWICENVQKHIHNNFNLKDFGPVHLQVIQQLLSLRGCCSALRCLCNGPMNPYRPFPLTQARSLTAHISSCSCIWVPLRRPHSFLLKRCVHRLRRWQVSLRCFRYGGDVHLFNERDRSPPQSVSRSLFFLVRSLVLSLRCNLPSSLLDYSAGALLSSIVFPHAYIYLLSFARLGGLWAAARGRGVRVPVLNNYTPFHPTIPQAANRPLFCAHPFPSHVLLIGWRNWRATIVMLDQSKGVY
jgi:hypothetical protein